jgi:hypothetical protein
MSEEKAELPLGQLNLAYHLTCQQIMLLGMGVELKAWFNEEEEKEQLTHVYSFGTRVAQLARLLFQNAKTPFLTEEEKLNGIKQVNLGAVRFQEAIANMTAHLSKDKENA